MQHILIDKFNEQNIEKMSRDFQTNTPFPHIVFDNFLNEESAEKSLSNFNINENWINYSFVNNFRKYGLADKKFMDKNMNEILDELGSKKIIDIVSKITGIKNLFLDKTLGGGGLNQVFNGGSLNVHTDFIPHIKEKKWKRVLNLIIYLNHDWKSTYKGELEFWDENVKNRVKSISPIFNRCIIFKTDKKSFHGHPEKMNLPEGVSRKTIIIYYLVEEEKEQKIYSTKYVGRPGDTLYTRFMIHLDTFLNKILTYSKRYGILNDKIASKILSFFKK